jgi:hypothetical protein
MDKVLGFFKTVEGQAISGIAAILISLQVGAVPQDLIGEFKGAIVALLTVTVQRVVKKSAAGETPFQPNKPINP